GGGFEAVDADTDADAAGGRGGWRGRAGGREVEEGVVVEPRATGGAGRAEDRGAGKAREEGDDKDAGVGRMGG
ncbi:hypothetical protein HK101_005971, partial [Irineochytrium annulatum]